LDLASLAALVPAPALLAGIIAVGMAAGFIKGLTGFGAALILSPGLTFFMDPTHAVATNVLTVALSNIPLLPGAKADADRPTAFTFYAGCLLGLPLGVWLLVSLPKKMLEAAIGITVIIASLLLLKPGVKARLLSRPLKLGAGLVGGMLNGSVGMGGPPVILALLAARTPPAVSRATLIVFFTLLNFTSVALMALGGVIDRQTLVLAALILPAMLLAQRGGELLFRRGWSKGFRPIAIALLVGTGVAALL